MLAAAAAHHAFSLWTWAGHFFGTSDETGPGYGFFSGVGSDIGEVTIIGGAILFYRHHTCHVDAPKFCWRPGRHPVDGTPYRACKRHHPLVEESVTAEVIAGARTAHVDAAGGLEAKVDALHVEIRRAHDRQMDAHLITHDAVAGPARPTGPLGSSASVAAQVSNDPGSPPQRVAVDLSSEGNPTTPGGIVG